MYAWEFILALLFTAPLPAEPPDCDSCEYAVSGVLDAIPQGPQASGAWSWSESTGTPILCSHCAKLLSDSIVCRTPEREKERVVKARICSSYLHRWFIQTAVPREHNRDVGHCAPVHFQDAT